MKVKTTKLVGALYALIGAVMSLPLSYRQLALALLLMLIVVLPAIVLTNNRWRYFNREMVPILLIASALSLLQCLNIFLYGTGMRTLILQLFFYVNTVLMLFAVRYFDPFEMIKAFVVASRLIFMVLFPLSIVGIEIMDNKNAVSMLMAMPVIYSWHIKTRTERTWGDVVWTLLAIVASLLHEARLATAIFGLVLLTSWLPRNELLRAFGMLLVGGAVWFNVYYAFNFDLVLNELLTNRILLWNYYADLAAVNLWTGVGPISDEVSQGAAAAMRLFLERGSNPQYGTQSMYVLYLYQAGIVGLTLALALFGYALLRARTLFWPLAILLISAVPETVSFGAPSIVGTPMTLIVIIAIIERHFPRRHPTSMEEKALAHRPPEAGKAARTLDRLRLS